MPSNTVTLTNGEKHIDVILKRWVQDPNFYKICTNRKNQVPQDFLVNVSQIAKIEDYIEPDLSLSEVKTF